MELLNFIVVKKKIVLFILLLAASLLVYLLLPLNGWIIPYYDRSVFYPFQAIRGDLFALVPFSIGDILYVIAGASVLAGFIRFVVRLFRFSENKKRVGEYVLGSFNAVLFVYLFFMVGWGGNYFKVSLSKYWRLNGDNIHFRLPSSADSSASDSLKKGRAAEAIAKVKADLYSFDSFLVVNLNQCAPIYMSLTFKDINQRAIKYYRQYTDTKLQKSGLGLKPTFFGYFLERLGVEGYYNPFTGEGQVNDKLPCFALPFLVAHEISHQAGIAAEGDANLMAYALCTATDDISFKYSAYLEIWLYTNRRLYYRDSALALQLEHGLNKLTQLHLDTLEQLSKKYDNEYARYSTKVFDSYLKMQDQKQGVRSYSNVATTAWKLEQERWNGFLPKLIRIP